MARVYSSEHGIENALERMFENNAIEFGALIENDDYVFARFRDDEGEWHDFLFDWELWDDVIDYLDLWDFEYDIYAQ